MIAAVKSGMPASLSPGIKPADLEGRYLDQKIMAFNNTHRQLLSSFSQRLRLVRRRVFCANN